MADDYDYDDGGPDITTPITPTTCDGVVEQREQCVDDTITQIRTIAR
jgi:hypothetical protein